MNPRAHKSQKALIPGRDFAGNREDCFFPGANEVYPPIFTPFGHAFKNSITIPQVRARGELARYVSVSISIKKALERNNARSPRTKCTAATYAFVTRAQHVTESCIFNIFGEGGTFS